jgi:uncharacterized protein YyaL (SSP411 family)
MGSAALAWTDFWLFDVNLLPHPLHHRILRIPMVLVLRRFAGQMVQVPTGLTAMLLALDYWLGPTQEIVVVAPAPPAQTLIEEYRRHFLPKATLLVPRSDVEAEALAAVPFTGNLAPASGPAVYICESHIRHRPVTTPEELGESLRAISGQAVGR